MPPKADLQGTFLPVVNAHAIVIFFYLKKKVSKYNPTYLLFRLI
jgi:hypothetical protein